LKPEGIREQKSFGEHWCNVMYLHPVAKVADVTVSNPNCDNLTISFNTATYAFETAILNCFFVLG
jgi:hypothetical protein